MGVNVGLSLREERRLRVLESRVLRKIFGPKGDEIGGGGEDRMLRTFVMCSAHKILLSDGIKNWMGEACGTPYQPIRRAYTHSTVLRLTIG